jgi:hypothetical protein
MPMPGNGDQVGAHLSSGIRAACVSFTQKA